MKIANGNRNTMEKSSQGAWKSTRQFARTWLKKEQTKKIRPMTNSELATKLAVQTG
jgi:hypothetical protein